MAHFSYRARGRDGRIVEGTLEAPGSEAVARLLGERGLIPVRIRPADVPVARGAPRGPFAPRVGLEELVMFCRQLRTLLHAGVPILRALKGLTETTRNPALREALADILTRLQEGFEFSAALAAHPRLFPPLFLAMIRVGESTGRLDEAFARLADYLQFEKQTRERVRSALRYPAIVLGAIVVAVVVINLWVIPAFADAFARYDTELPLMTRILLGTSAFFRDWSAALGLSAVLGALAVRQWLATPGGARTAARWMLRVPLVGDIVHLAVMARFARAMSMTLRAGVPLVQALRVVAGVVDNPHVAERIEDMRRGIEKGESITRTAAATGLFTPLVLQMLAVGEESGALDDLLDETAGHYEAEVEYRLSRLSDAIEPLVIVIIGAMVTVLALGVFLPLWDLSSAARG